jgi:hypothetical protein
VNMTPGSIVALMDKIELLGIVIPAVCLRGVVGLGHSFVLVSPPPLGHSFCLVGVAGVGAIASFWALPLFGHSFCLGRPSLRLRFVNISRQSATSPAWSLRHFGLGPLSNFKALEAYKRIFDWNTGTKMYIYIDIYPYIYIYI